MSLLRPLLFILLPFLLNACAHQAPVPPLDLQGAVPEVSARFVTERLQVEHKQHNAHKEDQSFKNEWLFYRTAQRIEVDIPAQQIGEVWLRDGKTVFYQKLFHADQKIVEYQMEDLSALDVSVSWRTNEWILDPAILQKLKVTGKDWIDGHPALKFSGSVDKIDYEVVWLVDLNLPHSLEKRDATGNQVRTELLSLEQTSESRNNYQHYETIDYADLGDRERDPFVMKIQGHLIGGNVHNH